MKVILCTNNGRPFHLTGFRKASKKLFIGVIPPSPEEKNQGFFEAFLRHIPYNSIKAFLRRVSLKLFLPFFRDNHRGGEG